MGIEIVKIRDRKQVRAFHRLPHRLYQNDPNWAPPFEFELESIFDPQKNKFFEYGECERYLVYKDGKVTARFAVMHTWERDRHKNPPMGGIGFIEMEHDATVCESMIDFAREWNRSRGFEWMQGPINFGENDTYWGLHIENHEEPPIYGMFYHKPYYKALLEQTGATRLDDHLSYKRYFHTGLPERLKYIVERLERRDDVEVRQMTPATIEEMAPRILDIYNEAWSTQDISEREEEFTPLSLEDILATAHKMKRVMIPEGNLMVFVDGEPASFLASIPDLYELSAELNGKMRWWHILKVLRFKNKASRLRTLAFGTKPKFRKMGLEVLAFVKGIQWIENNYPAMKLFEGGWVSEKNWLMQRSLRALGMEHHKTHRTYCWEIE